MKKIMKVKFISKISDNLKRFLLKRNVRYNSLMSILIAIFVAVVIVLNLVITKIVDRYDIKLDLSSNGLYKISQQTEKFLKSYEKDVKIILLDDEESLKNKNILTKHIYNIAKNIAAINSHISLEFVNLEEQPNFASKYSRFSLVEDGILIVSKDNEVRYIPVERLIDRKFNGNPLSGGGFSISSNVENMIAHALEFISGENKVSAAFLQGHDELDLTSAAEIFGENGYDIKSLNLITKSIDDNIDLIFLTAPRLDYRQEELEKLEEFLERGGNIVYFSSAVQPKLENLDAFFEKFGIKFEEGLVIETDTSKMMAQGPNFIFVYGDRSNKYTENMSDKKLPILLNDCRPIKIEKTNDNSVDIVDVCGTSETCSIYDKQADDFDFKGSKKSSFPLTVGITKKLDEGKSAKITVFSSIYMLDTVEIPQYGNGDFIFSVLGETAGHKTNIKILPKVIDNPSLVIDASTSNLIGIFFIFVIPLIIIVIGIFVNVRRKRR